MIYDLGELSLTQLAAHLGGADPRTTKKIAVALDLHPASPATGAYAWRDVFRRLHRLEPTRHADILAELKEPLITFQVLAAHLGKSPDALRKCLARGRIELQPPIVRSAGYRAWRPRDLRAWQMGEPLPVYVPPAETRPAEAGSAEGQGGRLGRDALLGARDQGLFGGFLVTSPSQTGDKHGNARTA